MPEAVVKAVSRGVLVKKLCSFAGGKDTMSFFSPHFSVLQHSLDRGYEQCDRHEQGHDEEL